MKKTILLCFIIVYCLPVQAQSPYIHKVFDFRPAPGQFVNKMPVYEEGDTHADMIRKVEKEIKGNKQGLVSLGAYGGYVVFGFDHLVENRPGKYDFKIWGNAYYSNPSNTTRGSSEPGIVWVSFDENGNGIPDDIWYEIAGSEYYKPETIRNYSIIYYKPDEDKIPTPDHSFPFFTDTTYIKWTDNQGNKGYVIKNSTHHDNSYYPQWLDEETITFQGVKLANNGMDISGNGSFFVQYNYPWGYADNHPNESLSSNFDIDWAVDENGNKVNLPGIHFVKVYTGVNQYCGFLGETSTEIMGAEDFHIQGIDIDVLAAKPETFHNTHLYYFQNRLHLLNLEGYVCSIFSIHGQLECHLQILDSYVVQNIKLPAGFYIAKIQNQNQIKTLKFLIP